MNLPPKVAASVFTFLMTATIFAGLTQAQPVGQGILPEHPIQDLTPQCEPFLDYRVSGHKVTANPFDTDLDGDSNTLELTVGSDPTDERSTQFDKDGDGAKDLPGNNPTDDPCDFDSRVPAIISLVLKCVHLDCDPAGQIKRRQLLTFEVQTKNLLGVAADLPNPITCVADPHDGGVADPDKSVTLTPTVGDGVYTGEYAIKISDPIAEDDIGDPILWTARCSSVISGVLQESNQAQIEVKPTTFVVDMHFDRVDKTYLEDEKILVTAIPSGVAGTAYYDAGNNGLPNARLTVKDSKGVTIPNGASTTWSMAWDPAAGGAGIPGWKVRVNTDVVSDTSAGSDGEPNATLDKIEGQLFDGNWTFNVTSSDDASKSNSGVSVLDKAKVSSVLVDDLRLTADKIKTLPTPGLVDDLAAPLPPLLANAAAKRNDTILYKASYQLRGAAGVGSDVRLTVKHVEVGAADVIIVNDATMTAVAGQPGNYSKLVSVPIGTKDGGWVAQARRVKTAEDSPNLEVKSNQVDLAVVAIKVNLLVDTDKPAYAVGKLGGGGLEDGDTVTIRASPLGTENQAYFNDAGVGNPASRPGKAFFTLFIGPTADLAQLPSNPLVPPQPVAGNQTLGVPVPDAVNVEMQWQPPVGGVAGFFQGTYVLNPSKDPTGTYRALVNFEDDAQQPNRGHAGADFFVNAAVDVAVPPQVNITSINGTLVGLAAIKVDREQWNVTGSYKFTNETPDGAPPALDANQVWVRINTGPGAKWVQATLTPSPDLHNGTWKVELHSQSKYGLNASGTKDVQAVAVVNPGELAATGPACSAPDDPFEVPSGVDLHGGDTTQIQSDVMGIVGDATDAAKAQDRVKRALCDAVTPNGVLGSNLLPLGLVPLYSPVAVARVDFVFPQAPSMAILGVNGPDGTLAGIGDVLWDDQNHTIRGTIQLNGNRLTSAKVNIERVAYDNCAPRTNPGIRRIVDNPPVHETVFVPVNVSNSGVERFDQQIIRYDPTDEWCLRDKVTTYTVGGQEVSGFDVKKPPFAGFANNATAAGKFWFNFTWDITKSKPAPGPAQSICGANRNGSYLVEDVSTLVRRTNHHNNGTTADPAPGAISLKSPDNSSVPARIPHGGGTLPNDAPVDQCNDLPERLDDQSFLKAWQRSAAAPADQPPMIEPGRYWVWMTTTTDKGFTFEQKIPKTRDDVKLAGGSLTDQANTKTPAPLGIDSVNGTKPAGEIPDSLGAVQLRFRDYPISAISSITSKTAQGTAVSATIGEDTFRVRGTGADYNITGYVNNNGNPVDPASLRLVLYQMQFDKKCLGSGDGEWCVVSEDQIPMDSTNFIGGYDGSATKATNQPFYAHWTPDPFLATAARFSTARSKTEAVWVPDDGVSATTWDQKAYIFGGATRGLAGNRDIVSFDPKTNELTTLSAQLPQPLSAASAIWVPSSPSCPSGCAYLFGGNNTTVSTFPEFDQNKIVRFIPATGAVATLTDADFTARAGTSAVYVSATQAYIFGGTKTGTKIFKFNPTTEDVTALGAVLPSARSGTAAVYATTNSKVYIFAGSGAAGQQVLEFDPSTEANPANLGNLIPSARSGVSAIWDGTDAYVFGGSANGNQILKFTPGPNTLTLLDKVLPKTGAITRTDTSAVFVPTDGVGATPGDIKAYIFGGSTAGGNPGFDIVRFDPVTGDSVVSAEGTIWWATVSLKTLDGDRSERAPPAVDKRNGFARTISQSGAISAPDDRYASSVARFWDFETFSYLDGRENGCAATTCSIVDPPYNATVGKTGLLDGYLSAVLFSEKPTLRVDQVGPVHRNRTYVPKLDEPPLPPGVGPQGKYSPVVCNFADGAVNDCAYVVNEVTFAGDITEDYITVKGESHDFKNPVTGGQYLNDVTSLQITYEQFGYNVSATGKVVTKPSTRAPVSYGKAVDLTIPLTAEISAPTPLVGAGGTHTIVSVHRTTTTVGGKTYLVNASWEVRVNTTTFLETVGPSPTDMLRITKSIFKGRAADDILQGVSAGDKSMRQFARGDLTVKIASQSNYTVLRALTLNVDRVQAPQTVLLGIRDAAAGSPLIPISDPSIHIPDAANPLGNVSDPRIKIRANKVLVFRTECPDGVDLGSKALHARKCTQIDSAAVINAAPFEWRVGGQNCNAHVLDVVEQEDACALLQEQTFDNQTQPLLFQLLGSLPQTCLNKVQKTVSDPEYECSYDGSKGEGTNFTGATVFFIPLTGGVDPPFAKVEAEDPWDPESWIIAADPGDHSYGADLQFSGTFIDQMGQGWLMDTEDKNGEPVDNNTRVQFFNVGLEGNLDTCIVGDPGDPETWSVAQNCTPGGDLAESGEGSIPIIPRNPDSIAVSANLFLLALRVGTDEGRAQDCLAYLKALAANARPDFEHPGGPCEDPYAPISQNATLDGGIDHCVGSAIDNGTTSQEDAVHDCEAALNDEGSVRNCLDTPSTTTCDDILTKGFINDCQTSLTGVAGAGTGTNSIVNNASRSLYGCFRPNDSFGYCFLQDHTMRRQDVNCDNVGAPNAGMDEALTETVVLINRNLPIWIQPAKVLKVGGNDPAAPQTVTRTDPSSQSGTNCGKPASNGLVTGQCAAEDWVPPGDPYGPSETDDNYTIPRGLIWGDGIASSADPRVNVTASNATHVTWEQEVFANVLQTLDVNDPNYAKINRQFPDGNYLVTVRSVDNTESFTSEDPANFSGVPNGAGFKQEFPIVIENDLDGDRVTDLRELWIQGKIRSGAMKAEMEGNPKFVPPLGDQKQRYYEPNPTAANAWPKVDDRDSTENDWDGDGVPQLQRQLNGLGFPVDLEWILNMDPLRNDFPGEPAACGFTPGKGSGPLGDRNGNCVPNVADDDRPILRCLPPDADTDGDGFCDLEEAAKGSDPNLSCSTPNDADCNGVPTSIQEPVANNLDFINSVTGKDVCSKLFTADCPHNISAELDSNGISHVYIDETQKGGTTTFSVGYHYTGAQPPTACATPATNGTQRQAQHCELVGTFTLNQGVEFVLAVVASAQELANDLDGDGSSNDQERAADSNPFYAFSTPADKGQGFLGGYKAPASDVTPLLRADWDGDGNSNIYELQHGTDPLHRCSDPGHPTQIPCGAP